MGAGEGLGGGRGLGARLEVEGRGGGWRLGTCAAGGVGDVCGVLALTV